MFVGMMNKIAIDMTRGLLLLVYMGLIKELCMQIGMSRISRKERIRNVTIRQQIGLEETIIK